MSGLPMICSALLNSQLGLVVQSAEAASVQPEAQRSAAAPTTGSPRAAAPAPAPAQDLEEWLLSDVVWDPFDMVRCPAAFVACVGSPLRPALRSDGF